MATKYSAVPTRTLSLREKTDKTLLSSQQAHYTPQWAHHLAVKPVE